jgi:chromosome segregation ATPase
MNNEEVLKQIGSLIDQKIKPLQEGQVQLQEGQAQIKTVLKALEAGQNDIRENMPTRADIQDLKAELAKKGKSHERRINTIEDELGIPHPEIH